MSEEEMIQEAFADELADVEQEEVEQEEQEEQDEDAPKGFMTKDAWVAAGKDPKEWTTPEVYAERRLRIHNESKLKREIREKEQDFDNRLRNVNLYAAAQLDRQRKELLARRDDAIDVADKASVKNIDKEISELDKQRDLIDREDEKPQVKKSDAVLEWESENEWCQDVNDPRLPIAQKVYVDAIKSGKTEAWALRAIDRELAKTQDKPKKAPIQMSDSSSTPNGSKDTGSVAWAQLTHEEGVLYDQMFAGAGVTKKDYLKIVADARRGV